VKIVLGRAFGWNVRMCVALVGLTVASCHSKAEAVRSASLTDVKLSPISGGYQICSPRALHACRALAVTFWGAMTLPVTDIAAAASCAEQQARATQRCAGVGKAYDAQNLRCLAGQGIWNSLLHDPAEASASSEKQRLTLRCAEGETWIDLITPI
jgi:hypothetical protein